MTSLSNAPVQATENRGEVKSDELRLGLPHWGSAVVAGGGKVGGRTRALVTRRPDSGSPTAFQAISSRVVSGGWHKRCQSFYQLKTIWINFLVSILSWRHKRKRTITKLLHKYRVVFFILNSTDRLSIGNGQPLARISTWDQWSRRTANKILRVQGSSSLILLLLLPLLL